MHIPTVPLKYVQYGVYGDLIIIYPESYSIDLRETIRLHGLLPKTVQADLPNATFANMKEAPLVQSHKQGFRVQGFGGSPGVPLERTRAYGRLYVVPLFMQPPPIYQLSSFLSGYINVRATSCPPFGYDICKQEENQSYFIETTTGMLLSSS